MNNGDPSKHNQVNTLAQCKRKLAMPVSVLERWTSVLVLAVALWGLQKARVTRSDGESRVLKRR